MKKFLFSLILLLVSYVGFSQKGLSYQAVILDPNKIEVPGQDISGQPLVNGDVWMKFSLFSGANLEFEEVQKTKTDSYGLVNLLIGSVSSASFNALVWDARQKNLQVFVSFNQGASYTKVSDQKLTYNPYSLFSETAGKLGGTLAISGGGTGATTAADARANLGLDQVNNTLDAAKPVSTATQAALNLKANKADLLAGLASKADTAEIKAYVNAKIGSNNSSFSNQSSSATISSAALATKADTAYVLAKFAAATIADADANSKGKIQLAGDLAGTASAPTVPGLALKANATDLTTLSFLVDANTASITSNVTNLVAISRSVDANTSSITANSNAITLKAPIASPVFTGTVAIGTSNPSEAAVLDITSTSKGLLLPRLTFAQKSAIVSPEAGLILWCSDCGTSGELQVYNGTNFVNMVGANAQFALPSMTSTAPASSITSSALTSGGVIDADGGAFVTARGVVWSTNANPTVSLSTKTTDGTGIGTFSSSITGLTSGITYFVRAYATNSVGTKYGPEISVNTAQAIATLTSTAVTSSIGSTSAISGGNITYNGGATVTTSGVVWSTTSTPTVALATKTTDGGANGSYLSTITGLIPGTLYYIRSYATNSVGTNYGAQTSFTTLNTASISATASVTSITATTATSGGTITVDGGGAVSSRGVVWGTSTGASTYSVTSGSGTGTFISNLTGLNPATTYFVRSFATNSVGTVYGAETSFTTTAIAPTLTTTAANSITKYTASAGGTISSDGGSAITATGICWSTTATPTTSNSKTTDGTNAGTFTSSLTGLTAGTTYYVRAYATNAIGTSYGAAQSFTTLATLIQTAVLIGTQAWTDKNLEVTSYRNGDAITFAANVTQWNAATNAGIGAWSYYDWDATNGPIFGKLYNWYAVSDSRGLAPVGYHIPTKLEYNTLATNSASSLKSTSPEWGASIGTNTTGFTGLPGGNITALGQFFDKGTSGWFWTSDYDNTDPLKAYFRLLHISAGFVDVGGYSKKYGMSVRLVKDNNTIENTVATPTLSSTTTASSISSSIAILGGNVIDEGLTQVSARGLVYGTSTGASTFSVTVGSGAGTFTSTLTGLTQGTTYYVRSFATNQQGTGYGVETSFTTQTTPTISATTTPTSLATTSAIGGGTISNSGGATVLTSGLVWDASANPTIALSTKTTDGTTSGAFTSSITGLTQGTTYHVRAYATNSIGTSYGPDITFTTLTTPTVSATATISSITGTTATGGGTISTDGGTAVTARGLVWGTTTGSSTYSVTTGTGAGIYTSSLTGLSIATIYYVRAFATNSVGTTYGPEVTFATPSTATLASTITSTITTTTAILGGVLNSNGGATTSIGIRYSTDINFGTYSTTTINANASAGTYTTTITGLVGATTYYAKSYATNTAGTSFGPSINFTTLESPKTIGQIYGGGAVFYILKPADYGYDPNVQHGLIVSPSDQSTGIRWYNGSYTTTGATEIRIGYGLANTNAIIASQGGTPTTYAAGLARAYTGGGYTDWYLPSINELRELNLVSMYSQIPAPYSTMSTNQWSSTESSYDKAIFKPIGNADNYIYPKETNFAVRAIRSF